MSDALERYYFKRSPRGTDHRVRDRKDNEVIAYCSRASDAVAIAEAMNLSENQSKAYTAAPGFETVLTSCN